MNVENSDNESGDSELPKDGVLEEKIAEIAEEFLRQLRNDGEVDRQSIIDAHPELAPKLGIRLKIVSSIYRASQDSDGAEFFEAESHESLARRQDDSTSADVSRMGSIRIRCPHCGNHVQLVGLQPQREITCGSCGSSISVEPDITRTDQTNFIRKIGRYRTRRLLGQGAFGLVYLADDPKLDRSVAIKVPRRGYFSSPSEEERFFREARSAAQLRHANIVQVYEISEDSDLPFIVSEFIDGLTLGDIASSGLLSFRETARFMIQIGKAIGFAHEHGIIHRDLKPSNILVDHSRNPFVADFGLARREDGEITMTVDGLILGTPAYMSPEQAAGISTQIDGRSDIYSLGVILFQMLTRELPFRGTKRMLIHQVISDEPKNPRAFNEKIPRDLETITLKAMAKIPEERYQTADHFAAELERWMAGEPIHARPISRLTRWVRWCKRHPTVAALIATIAALMLIGAALAITWAIRESNLKTIATNNQLESDARLRKIVLQNGIGGFKENNLAESAFWFANALGDSDSPMDKLRFNLTYQFLPKLNQMWVDESSVSAIQLNASGSRVLSGFENGKIIVAEVNSGDIIASPEFPPFRQVQFADDGRSFLTFADDQVRLWDVDSNRLVKSVSHPTLTSADFHSNGDLMATTGRDSILRLWNVSDGSLNREMEIEGWEFSRVSFAPDSDIVVAIIHEKDQFNNEIVFWNFVTGETLSRNPVDAQSVFRLIFSPDGARAVTCTTGQAKIWNTMTGAEVALFEVGNDEIRSAYFGGDDDVWIPTAKGDIIQWNIIAESSFRYGNAFPRSARFVDLNIEKELLAYGTADGRIQIRYLRHNSPACTAISNGESISRFAFHPDGRRIFVGSDNGVVQLLDLAGTSPDVTVLQHQGEVQNAFFTLDGARCLTADMSGSASIWDVTTGEQVGAVIKHEGAILNFAVSKDGKILATASADKTVRTWSTVDGSPIGPAYPHESPVAFVAIHPESTQLVTGTTDGTVSGWTIAKGIDVPSPTFQSKQKSRITHLRYNDDGSLIAGTDLSGGVLCLDVETGIPQHGPFQIAAPALHCEFIPNKQQLLACGGDKTTLWDLETNSIRQELSGTDRPRSVQVLDEGKTLAINESNGPTRIWHLESGQYIAREQLKSEIRLNYHSDRSSTFPLQVFCGGTNSANHSPSHGGTGLWDLVDDIPFAPTLTHNGLVRRVRFNSTGTYILTASSDNTARLWRVRPSELSNQEARRFAGLYSQFTADGLGATRLAPRKLQSEFNALRKRFPSEFSSTASELNYWQNKIGRIKNEGNVENK